MSNYSDEFETVTKGWWWYMGRDGIYSVLGVGFLSTVIFSVSPIPPHQFHQ